jgi:hypothetical protein
MRRILAAIIAVFLLFPSSAPAQTPQGRPVVAVYQMDDLAQSGASDTFSTMIETAIASTAGSVSSSGSGCTSPSASSRWRAAAASRRIGLDARAASKASIS